MSYVWNSAEIVLTLLLAAGCGVILVRKNILHPRALSDLSRIMVSLVLPCLLFSKIIAAVSIDSFRQLWVFPVCGIAFVFAGLLLGWLVARLCRQPELSRGFMAGMAFGNSAYIPLAIVAAIAFQNPDLFGSSDGVARGVTFISLYLVTFSPLMWLIGYPVLTHRSLKGVKLTQILPPPVIASLSAILLGLIPFTHNLFLGADAPLKMVHQAAAILGQATVPLALLILGGNLAHGTHTGIIKPLSLAGFSAGRFVIMPLFALAVMLILRAAGFISSPMMAFIIVLQGCVPPGMNLVVMCQLQERNREFMATLMFWSYLAAIPALAVWLYIIMRVIS